MRYRCPICSFEFIGGGFCPSPYHVATMMVELPEIEIKVDPKEDIAKLDNREPEIGKDEKTIIEIEEV